MSNGIKNKVRKAPPSKYSKTVYTLYTVAKTAYENILNKKVPNYILKTSFQMARDRDEENRQTEADRNRELQEQLKVKY